MVICTGLVWAVGLAWHMQPPRSKTDLHAIFRQASSATPAWWVRIYRTPHAQPVLRLLTAHPPHDKLLTDWVDTALLSPKFIASKRYSCKPSGNDPGARGPCAFPGSWLGVPCGPRHALHTPQVHQASCRQLCEINPLYGDINKFPNLTPGEINLILVWSATPHAPLAQPTSRRPIHDPTTITMTPTERCLEPASPSNSFFRPLARSPMPAKTAPAAHSARMLAVLSATSPTGLHCNTYFYDRCAASNAS